MKKPLIIGAGISGLVAATYLAKHGIQATVIEAENDIGGCCANTKINGYTFNDGALFLLMPSMLDLVFKQLELEREQLLPLKRVNRVQSLFLPDGVCVRQGPGFQFHIIKNGQPVADETITQDLEKLCHKWDSMLDLFQQDILVTPFSNWRFFKKAWRYLPQLGGNAASDLKHLIRNSALRAALAASLLYASIPLNKMPTLSLIGIVSVLRDGVFLPQDGMGQITRVISDAAKTAGVTILSGTAVKKIVTEKHRIRGLETRNGDWFDSDSIISSISGMSTYSLMSPKPPGSVQKRINRAPLSHRTLNIQLGLRNNLSESQPLLSHYNGILPYMEQQDQSLRFQDHDIQWFNFYLPSRVLPKLAPRNGSVLEMFVYVDPNISIEQWTDTLKYDITQRTLEALNKRFTLDIQVQRIRSPKDFQDQLGLYQGAVYGTRPGINPNLLFPHKSQIHGLYHAGQTTYPGFGVASAAMSGIFAATALINDLDSNKNATIRL